MAATLYLLVPYRAVDVYSRFAFAETGAFLWLPLLVKFLHDLERRASYGAWAGLTLAFAGLLLTQVTPAVLALLVLGIYALGLGRDRAGRRVLPLVALAGVVGAAQLRGCLA